MRDTPLKVLIGAINGRSRETLLRLLSQDGSFQVCHAVSHASDVLSFTKKLRPNVIILSDTLESSALGSAIADVMVECPTPIVILSANDPSENSAAAIDALRAGALSIVRLPAQSTTDRRARVEAELLATVRAMAQVKLVRRWRQRQSLAPPGQRDLKGRGHVVAMAASTGGPAVLKIILDKLPANFPAPVLIVQHIAHGFIPGVTEWLDQTSPLKVTVARPGERLLAGSAYFAPDELHLGVRNRSSLHLSDNEPINGFRPSATYLFGSVAKIFEENAVGVILTGMGDDGLDGLRLVAAMGGRVIAQSQSSSVVFGMPGVVVRAGIADQVLEPDAIAGALVEACSRGAQE